MLKTTPEPLQKARELLDAKPEEAFDGWGIIIYVCRWSKNADEKLRFSMDVDK